MGYQSLVYGRIIGSRYPWGGNTNIVNNGGPLLFHRLNRLIIEELPEEDNYPQLTRQMFTLPSLKGDDGLYKNQVIAFGASYKEVELEWMDWLVKFENLLSQLFWTEAIVHLETEARGNYTYTWKNTNDQPFTPNLKSSRDNWKFQGGPLEFQ